MSIQFVTVDEYVSLSQESAEWLVHGLIPRPSKILFHGEPKAGKSFLALGVANAVASGVDVLGHRTVKSRVLYLQLDVSAATWKKTLTRLIESDTRFDENLVLIHPASEMRPLNLLEPRTCLYLRNVVQDCQPDMVIVDVYRKLHSADENDSTEMKVVDDRLTELFGGVALILVHHARKIPDDVTNPKAIRYARGSGAITGDMDAVWMLHDSRLSVVPRWDEEGLYRLCREDNGMWTYQDVQIRAEEAALALQICADHPELSHNRLVPIARAKHGWGRSKFYRLLDGRVCAHELRRREKRAA